MGAWPRVGRRVPPPMEPRTKRGHSGVEYSSAFWRARVAAAWASSRARSTMSYSTRPPKLALKLLVSTQSAPAAR